MKKWLMRVFNVKDEKGLTLIELLAVIVILGIIAAIAVPSITGITNNTKKEAHRANATQIVEAAKQYVAINGYKEGTGVAKTMKKAGSDGKPVEDTTAALAENKYMSVPLNTLISSSYFPDAGIADPEGGTYDKTDTVVYIKEVTTGTNKAYKYWINLAKSASVDYFTDMIYDDVLDGEAKPQ